jgi:lysozyme
MKASEEIKAMIKRFEGCRLTAYKDSVGVLTIGYGHTGSDVKQGLKITQAKADELFDKDLAKFEVALTAAVSGVKVNQYQFDALLSFAFNLGIAKLKGSTLFKKVKANPNDTTIGAEFRRWVYAGGKILPGLITRRDEEAKWYYKA